MPHLSKNCQGDMLCWNAPSTASSQRPNLAANDASPYRCSDANTQHDYTLDDEWSTAVRLSHASGVAAKFPEILHLMLEDIYQIGDDSIASWQPHGRAFRVHKKQRFVETVLPKFFGHSNYTSFTRQLNLYCFQRIKVGRDKGAYYHELFLRSQPYRCRHIVRQVVKGNSAKGFAYSEPNFYAIPASNMQINGSLLEESNKLIALFPTTPKLDTKKKIALEGDHKRKNLVRRTTKTSSQLDDSTIHKKNIDWLDSFPLLYGLPYCEEPTWSFFASLLESKGSDQMQSRKVDNDSFSSGVSFYEQTQDQNMFRVKDIEDLLKM